MDLPEENALKFVCGFLIKKCIAIHPCNIYIGSYLFELAQNITFEVPCPDFPKVFLIKLFLRMRIYYTLSQHNKSPLFS
ncbi:uncharacterized protein LOC114933986 [Nylanderia fulva]|uniref:uncharacterized protein LOC114933986 n=1 Tax=Nylanderia fulva TaxID=613905 RepID=UPI0010FB074E|nr:uncharacterized protein LOC114933986 [Nylanderia fulva]